MGTQNATKNRLKPAVWSPATVVFIFALIFVIAIGFYTFGPARYIGATQVSAQEIGGAAVTNYMPILAEDVDWEALSDAERVNVARYAVNTAMAQATNDSAENFRVVGLSHLEKQPAFLFSGGETLFIYFGGEATSVPLSD
jgi:hypothetical protein